MSESRPTTLGELRASGWASVPVRQELRRNATERIRSGRPLFDDVLGYHNTVIPQVENALLAGHDMIMLGERGQAKTRMIRGLVGLLDEWMPIVATSEINDDPYAPVSARARALVAEHGDDTPIAWIHRDDRYGEKLATPDTSIADLIGEVDPIKVAEGRYLSDELTLHYGLVPRTNRGIFAINELPDLAERIQVGLLNVLEERDVQIRGYKVRLPLDVVLVASANPEDYTNRGRIITPLKDRFGAQVRTHYPLDAGTEIAIVDQEAYVGSGGAGSGGAGPGSGDDGDGRDPTGVAVTVPSFMTRIVVALTRAARSSSHVSQRSGVSVRLSISNTETMVANAVRRSLRAGSDHAVPRVTDLEALTSSTAGKVEIETLEEGREAEILERLVSSAVLSVFKDSVPPDLHRAVVDAFDEDLVVDVGDDVADADYAGLLATVPALTAPVQALLADDEAAESPAMVAAAVELVLEGLHLSKRLNKDAQGPRAQYRAR
jgi:magnesium chelatase subunit I